LLDAPFLAFRAVLVCASLFSSEQLREYLLLLAAFASKSSFLRQKHRCTGRAQRNILRLDLSGRTFGLEIIADAIETHI